MAITKADVLVIAPELSGVDDATFTAYINDAALLLTPEAWGPRYSLVHKYLVAHMLSTRAGGSGAAGTLTSMAVGEVRVTYANMAQKKSGLFDWLSTTPYGRFIVGLRRQYGMHIAVVP